MTKLDKLREIIRRDVSSGFMHQLEIGVRNHKHYARKLNDHPDFILQCIEEIVEKQLPFYDTVSEEAVNAAHVFFMSSAGAEWCKLSANFSLHLNDLAPVWAADILKQLQNLN